jgi:uncharacterized protein (TIGR03000 family)
MFCERILGWVAIRRRGGQLLLFAAIAGIAVTFCIEKGLACGRRVSARCFCTPCSYYYSASALVVVHVPAGAKIYIDDNPTKQTSTTRSFLTPPLPVGQDYTYLVKAEVTQHGKVMFKTKRISVRAFNTTHVRFTDFGPSRPSKRSLRPPLDLPDPPPGLDLDGRP